MRFSFCDNDKIRIEAVNVENNSVYKMEESSCENENLNCDLYEFVGNFEKTLEVDGFKRCDECGNFFDSNLNLVGSDLSFCDTILRGIQDFSSFEVQQMLENIASYNIF